VGCESGTCSLCQFFYKIYILLIDLLFFLGMGMAKHTRDDLMYKCEYTTILDLFNVFFLALASFPDTVLTQQCLSYF